MLQKIFKGIFIVILGIVCLVIWGGIWSDQKQADYKRTAVPYMTKAIHDISTWDIDVFKKYMDPELVKSSPEADLTNFIKVISKMGDLIKLGEPKFLNDISEIGIVGSSINYISYSVPALYSLGDATVNITLKETEGKLVIHKFNLESQALFE
jgi:hypothetical protein